MRTWEDSRDFISLIYLSCCVFEQVAFITTGINCTGIDGRRRLYKALDFEDPLLNAWEKIYQINNSIKHIPRPPLGDKDLGPWYNIGLDPVVQNTYVCIRHLLLHASKYPDCPENFRPVWVTCLGYFTEELIYYCSPFSKTVELITLYLYVRSDVLRRQKELASANE